MQPSRQTRSRRYSAIDGKMSDKVSAGPTLCGAEGAHASRDGAREPGDP